jgi:hypothetical protein
MKNKLVLFSITVSIFAFYNSAYGQTQTEDAVNVSKQQRFNYEHTSAYFRTGKQYAITGQLFGAGPVKTGSAGISLGYYLNDDAVASLEYMSGSATSSSSFFAESKYEAKSNSIGLHLKKFEGNSFYWKPGVDYSQLKVDYNYTSTFFGSTSSSTRELEGDILSASIVIGNQWQWENFTLGCDWVGLSIPVSSNTKVKRLSTTFTDNIDQERLNEDEKLYFKTASLHLLRFYLGASF